MNKAPTTIPVFYRDRWLAAVDIDQAIARRGYDRMVMASASISFVKRMAGRWVRHQNLMRHVPAGAIPLAEVAFHFADGSKFRCITGHDLPQAEHVLRLATTQAAKAGAKLMEVAGATDTVFLDLTAVDDYCANRNGPGISYVACRLRGDLAWAHESAIRFKDAGDRWQLQLQLAEANGDFIRPDYQGNLPKNCRSNAAFVHEDLYIRPSSIVAVYSMRAFDDKRGRSVPASAGLHVFYGAGRCLHYPFGHNIDSAKMAARGFLSLNKRLMDIDDRRMFFADVLRFRHASGAANPEWGPSAPVVAGNHVYVFFKDVPAPLKLTLPTVDAAQKLVQSMNQRIAKARAPRIITPSMKKGEVLPFRLT